jgi:hypothetical protein
VTRGKTSTRRKTSPPEDLFDPLPLDGGRLGSPWAALAAGLLVLVVGTWLVGNHVSNPRTSWVPLAVLGLAVLVAGAVLIRGQAGNVVGAVVAAVLVFAVVQAGAAPAFGAAMGKAGAAMSPGKDAAPCTAARHATRPADGKCVPVPKCPTSRPQIEWTAHGTKPVCSAGE